MTYLVVGMTAPLVAEKTTAGQMIRADTYPGTVLILNSWCAGHWPCRIGAIDQEAIRQKYTQLQPLERQRGSDPRFAEFRRDAVARVLTVRDVLSVNDTRSTYPTI